MSKVKDALYGEFDVTEDRNLYIGGSDIPAILGISPFTTRWQLLLQKAGLEERSFTGNRFTEYGHDMEPVIRAHVNKTFATNFVPNRVIDGDIRYHADGFDGTRVLEVKTTSEVHATVDSYKIYLVQLLKGMEENEVDDGILAVYERPENLSLEFDHSRLQIFEIKMEDYRKLLDHVNAEIDKFRADLERLKENPLLSEQDFLPSGNLAVLADKIAKFEKQIAAIKEIEEECKKAKKQLYQEMLNRNVKSWSTPNGTKITRVDEVPAGTKTVTEFDAELFKIEYPDLWKTYSKQIEKKTSGKAGYVRIQVK